MSEVITPVTVIGDAAIGGTATVDSGDIAVVAGNLSSIDIVSNSINSVITDATNIASINTVAASNTQVVSVGNNMTKVQSVYDKLGELNRYYTTFIGTSASDPTLRLDGAAVATGDLYYSTTMPGMKVKTAVGWEAAGSGISGTFKFSAGSVTVPSITTFGDENTGVFFPAADTVAVTTTGVERLRINSSGNVGIGTSPINKLHLYNGTISVGATQLELEGRYNAYGAGINFSSRTSDGGTLVTMAKITADGEDLWNTTGTTQDAGLRFSTTANGTLTERLRIDSSGNVGIGETSPSFIQGGGLHIKNGDRANLKLQDSRTNVLTEISVADNGFSSNFIVNVDPTNVGSGGCPLIIRTGGGTERLRIDSSGNVTLTGTIAGASQTLSGTLAVTGAITATGGVTGNVSGSAGSCTGNAATATALATGRTVAITGDVSYTSGSFDGSSNVTGTATLASSGVTAGNYGGAASIPSITVDAKGRVTAISTNAVVIAAGAVGGGSDRIFWENDQTVTTSYTLTSNKNAVTAGPITVNTGVTVTIPTGGVWTVV